MATNTTPQGSPAPRTRLEAQGVENERAESGLPQTANQATSNNISREEEQRGTRRIWMWGIAVIAAIFVALLGASFFATTS